MNIDKKIAEWHQFALTIKDSDFPHPIYIRTPREKIENAMRKAVADAFTYDNETKLISDPQEIIKFDESRLGSLEINVKNKQMAEAILDYYGLPFTDREFPVF